jgi:ParB-like chromosome segregation protein Spo0J
MIALETHAIQGHCNFTVRLEPDWRKGKNMPRVSVGSITIGKRYRQDMGDLETLVRSIREVGLINRITVLKDGTLVAGHRRLEAVKMLGWSEVQVHVVDLDLDVDLTGSKASIIQAECDENVIRKELTVSERVAIGRVLEEQERAKAKAREKSHTKTGYGKLPDPEKGEALEKVAAAATMSRHTYEKAKAVVEAAEANPELQPIVEEMDKTGKVDPAYKRIYVKNRMGREATSEFPPVCLCDPSFARAMDRLGLVLSASRKSGWQPLSLREAIYHLEQLVVVLREELNYDAAVKSHFPVHAVGRVFCRGGFEPDLPTGRF